MGQYSLKNIFPCQSMCVKPWQAPLDSIDNAQTYFAFLGSTKRAIEILIGNLFIPSTGQIFVSPDITIRLAQHMLEAGISEGPLEDVVMKSTDFFCNHFSIVRELEVSVLEFRENTRTDIFIHNISKHTPRM